MQKTGKIKKKSLRQEDNWSRYSFQLDGSEEWLSVITNRDTPEDLIKKLDSLKEGDEVAFEVEEKTSGGKKFLNIKSIEQKPRVSGGGAVAIPRSMDERNSIERQTSLKAAVEFVAAIYGKDYAPGDIVPDEQVRDRILFFAEAFYSFIKGK